MKLTQAEMGKIIWNIIFKPDFSVTIEYASKEEAKKEFERIKKELEVILEILG